MLVSYLCSHLCNPKYTKLPFIYYYFSFCNNLELLKFWTCEIYIIVLYRYAVEKCWIVNQRPSFDDDFIVRASSNISFLGCMGAFFSVNCDSLSLYIYIYMYIPFFFFFCYNWVISNSKLVKHMKFPFWN